MGKFKVNEEVFILGESIGGFDYKGQKGIIVQDTDLGLYKVQVADRIITYKESKITHYTQTVVDELIEAYKKYIQEYSNSFKEE